MGRSEHSFANAIDISAFITTDGRTIDIIIGWGPTGPDRRVQALSGERKNKAEATRDPFATLKPM
jgi:hypothetical protein